MTNFVPATQPACNNYQSCYAACMQKGNLERFNTEKDATIALLNEKIDELNVKLNMNISGEQYKRDTETFERLQELEAVQRNAADHLEQENGRLRALLLKAGVDDTVPVTTATEDIVPAKIAGFFG